MYFFAKPFFIFLSILFCFYNFSWASNNVLNNEVIVIKPYSMKKFNQAINNLYNNSRASHDLSLVQRLIADSNIFIGKPYHLGALGEGPNAVFDKDSLYRTDQFDCMTFVSTVLALVESDDLRDFKKTLLNIRYANGKPSYFTRNHFTSVDWNRNNESKGYITNLTTQLFPKDFKIANAIINKPNWYLHLTANNLKQFKHLSKSQTQKLLLKLHAFGEKSSILISHMPYLPLVALYAKNKKPIQSMFAKIPNGTIIEIVRPNWNIRKLVGTNLNISHLGFAVRIDGVLYFREASSLEDKIIDIPLEKYLANYLESPTVKGISILGINLIKHGTGDRTRTDTVSLQPDFESGASTNFATPAN